MANKTTLNLNISERLAGLAQLNAFKGNLDKLAVILNDLPPFSVTDEEWTKAERKIVPMGENNQWLWNDEKGGDKAIEIGDVTKEYLRTAIKEKNDKNEFTLQDKAYITLLTKLG